jgi:hypothetical protein
MQHVAVRVEETIVSILRRSGPDASHTSLLRSFISEEIVMGWVSNQPPDVIEQIITCSEATAYNVAVLNELWKLFANHGIHLRTSHKIVLFESYLGDN